MATYHGIPAVELGQMVVNEMLARHDVSVKEIEQLVYGQVVQMPEAPNIAREIVLATGMDVNTDAYSVSRACATSFQAVASVAQAMVAGDVSVAVAGGADQPLYRQSVFQRNSLALWSTYKSSTLGQRWAIIRRLGLRSMPVPPAVAEYSTGLSMGQTAEQMAKTHGITERSKTRLLIALINLQPSNGALAFSQTR